MKLNLSELMIITDLLRAEVETCEACDDIHDLYEKIVDHMVSETKRNAPENNKLKHISECINLENLFTNR